MTEIARQIGNAVPPLAQADRRRCAAALDRAVADETAAARMNGIVLGSRRSRPAPPRLDHHARIDAPGERDARQRP